MKIKTVHLDDDGNPSSVVAEITIEEAAYIADHAGRDTEEITSGMYHALITRVFNPYWADGLYEYQSGSTE